MSTMRAVQVVGYHQSLELKEVPVPTPAGPFDVVVRIGRSTHSTTSSPP
jgi:NAD+-dependent secondary alcohol dehydrogenase Adh1